MKNWREIILKEFSLRLDILTLVADPHGLLQEEKIIEKLGSLGYEILWFEEPISFRYIYEARFRSRWDRGEDVYLILAFKEENFNILPYDLLQIGKRLSFHLSDIFPGLDYTVVANLDCSDFDVLYEAVNRYSPKNLGEDATKDFILRHVFKTVPELIKTPSDLLKVLLQRHYSRKQIPEIFDKYLIECLRKDDRFKDWPLEIIIPDREVFFTFLQERWPIFLSHISGYEKVCEDHTQYGLKIPGPTYLPFDHQDVRVYVDNLFLEGILKPVPFEKTNSLPNEWFRLGIISSGTENITLRIDKLFERLKSDFPSEDVHYDYWRSFARRYAELIFLVMQCETFPNEYHQHLDNLKRDIDKVFVSWMLKRYQSLINLPGLVMLHHIPRFLAHEISENPDLKIAFVLVDGLSLDQWLAVKHEVQREEPSWCFEEEAVFSWVPTITSVSRQAAFSGSPPWYFAESIDSTQKEAVLWYQFWGSFGFKSVGQSGYAKGEVAYVKNVEKNFNVLEELVENPRLRILGLIINRVDRIMHGMELGIAGMHSQIRQWVKEGFFHRLLKTLWDNGFSIYLSSDHGNIEARGCGRPREGVLAEERGQRVRVFRDFRARRKIRKQFPNAIEWPPIGLPEDYFALLAAPRQAFVNENGRIVCHGGITVEEVIVPFVKIIKKQRLSSQN